MGDEWLWTPKPSFLSAWRALPPKETHQVLEKITLLEQDPMPDGKAKIQVKRKYQSKTVYRIRSLVPESYPGYSTGGSERSFHASSLPPLRRKIGSCVGSLRLWGRRAPALEMPKLRGKTCPSFARS